MFRYAVTTSLVLISCAAVFADLRLPRNAKGRDANKPTADAPLPPPPIDADAVGTYTTGGGGIGGFGYELRVFADGGYAMYISSCIPAGEPDRGRATIEGQEMVLSNREGKEVARYTAVAWGPRRYLIADMLAFVNSINLGDEPRTEEHGRALLGVGEWRKKVDGVPALAKPWTDRVLPQPINGVVTAVDPDGNVTIDLGTARGVFDGMELTMGIGGSITITAARERDATGKPSFAAKVGDAVSSRRPAATQK